MNYRNTLWDFVLSSELCPHNSRSRSTWDEDFSFNKLCIRQQIHRVMFSSNIVTGIIDAPKSEKCSCRLKARYLLNGVVGKPFDQQPSYCTSVFCLIKRVSEWQKFNWDLKNSRQWNCALLNFFWRAVSYSACYAPVGDRRTAHFGGRILPENCTSCIQLLAQQRFGNGRLSKFSYGSLQWRVNIGMHAREC